MPEPGECCHANAPFVVDGAEQRRIVRTSREAIRPWDAAFCLRSSSCSRRSPIRQGAHGVARDALFAALPFAAVAALVSFGGYIDSASPLAGVQALCSGAIVAFLVVSCAARNASVHGVPPLGGLVAARGRRALRAQGRARAGAALAAAGRSDAGEAVAAQSGSAAAAARARWISGCDGEERADRDRERHADAGREDVLARRRAAGRGEPQLGAVPQEHRPDDGEVVGGRDDREGDADHDQPPPAVLVDRRRRRRSSPRSRR